MPNVAALTIAELPFVERPVRELLHLDIDREQPSREFSGFGWARVDAVWLFGPHPLALLFALTARAAKVPVVLGVRQDYPRYVAGRLPGRGWAWAIGAARLLDEAWRLLARGMPTVALGSELAERPTGFRLCTRPPDIAASLGSSPSPAHRELRRT